MLTSHEDLTDAQVTDGRENKNTAIKKRMQTSGASVVEAATAGSANESCFEVWKDRSTNSGEERAGAVVAAAMWTAEPARELAARAPA